jgi:hypothetical protein
MIIARSHSGRIFIYHPPLLLPLSKLLEGKTERPTSPLVILFLATFLFVCFELYVPKKKKKKSFSIIYVQESCNVNFIVLISLKFHCGLWRI